MISQYLQTTPKPEGLSTEARQDYEQWLRHPRTQALLRLLGSECESCFSIALAQSLSTSFSADQVRAYLVKFVAYNKVIESINNPTA